MQRSAVALEVSDGQGRNLVYCVAKGKLTSMKLSVWRSKPWTLSLSIMPWCTLSLEVLRGKEV